MGDLTRGGEHCFFSYFFFGKGFIRRKMGIGVCMILLFDYGFDYENKHFMIPNVFISHAISLPILIIYLGTDSTS